MDLRTAIQRAAKFAPTGKAAPELLRAVRLLPSSEGHPSRLFATGGHVGVLVDVEGVELPPAVLPLDPLRKAIKGAASVDAVARADVGEMFDVVVTSKATRERSSYRIQGWDPSRFPGFPMFPTIDQMDYVAQWDAVKGVIHAVGTDAMKPELQVIAFGSGWVQASDRDRIARQYVDVPWRGYIHADVFRGWPRGEVHAYVDDTYSWWRVGGELRYGVVQRGNRFHERFDAHLPRVWEGARVVVDRVRLRDGIARALDVSAWKTVGVELGSRGIVVRGYNDGVESDVQHEVEVPVLTSHGESAAKLLYGKYLLEAVDAAPTSRLRIGYHPDPNGLIRIESGPLVQVIWPSPA